MWSQASVDETGPIVGVSIGPGDRLRRNWSSVAILEFGVACFRLGALLDPLHQCAIAGARETLRTQRTFDLSEVPILQPTLPFRYLRIANQVSVGGLLQPGLRAAQGRRWGEPITHVQLIELCHQ